MLRGTSEVSHLLPSHAAVVPCLCLIMCCLLAENDGQEQNY